MDWKSNKKIRKFIVNYLIFCILFSSFMLVLAGYENYLNRRRILTLTTDDPTLAAKVITVWESTQKCLIPDEPTANDMQESIHIIEDKYGYELHRLASDPILWLFWGTGLFAGLLFTSALAYVHFYKSRQGSGSLKRQQELYECLEQYRNGNYEYIPDYTNASEEWLKIGESLRELGVYFSALRQQLKTEENNTKTFITDISHQLKTPLASLKMSYELAAGNWLKEDEKKEFFTRGEKEIEKLELLLHELVKLSRLETHMIQLNPVLTGFRRTLTAAVSQIYMKAKDKNIDICIHMENDIILRHDIKWTEEAIANVLDNCVKYSSEHTVVTVRVIPLVANMLLEIEDEGMGIRPEELQKIYQRFYRGAQAKQKTKEGAGIGLYLARMILERQGGTISARRKIDKNGTVFKITLPLEPERLQKIPYKTVIEL